MSAQELKELRIKDLKFELLKIDYSICENVLAISRNLGKKDQADNLLNEVRTLAQSLDKQSYFVVYENRVNKLGVYKTALEAVKSLPADVITNFELAVDQLSFFDIFEIANYQIFLVNY